MKHLVWFRADLRVADNTALHAAAHEGTGVAGLYVISPGDCVRHDTAPVRVDFILRNLTALSAALSRLNIPLFIRHAPRPADVPLIVDTVANEFGATSVHFNREYEVDESRRDEALTAILKRRGITCCAYTDQVILAPGSVLTKQGTPYTVFTPFKRAWLEALDRDSGVKVLPLPRKQPPNNRQPDSVPHELNGFTSRVPVDQWPAGEAHARQRLEVFCTQRIKSYHERRDFPALDGTSTLSPYLAAGILSPRQGLAAAAEANGGRLDSGLQGPQTWVSELIWREFYKHIVAAFPRVSMGLAFKRHTEVLAWSTNTNHLEAWKSGLTGFPIVDAAMRQLAQTGWMHNRLRMVTAMFLSKDLFLDWRWGEKHFMLNLIDGDLAANNGGWQWSASTGTDAAPYFRIFNPASQSERYDPDGVFIKQYCPELAELSGKSLHHPEALPPLVRARLGYPEPIIDHAKARDRVLAAFKAVGG